MVLHEDVFNNRYVDDGGDVGGNIPILNKYSSSETNNKDCLLCNILLRTRDEDILSYMDTFGSRHTLTGEQFSRSIGMRQGINLSAVGLLNPLCCKMFLKHVRKNHQYAYLTAVSMLTLAEKVLSSKNLTWYKSELDVKDVEGLFLMSDCRSVFFESSLCLKFHQLLRSFFSHHFEPPEGDICVDLATFQRIALSIMTGDDMVKFEATILKRYHLHSCKLKMERVNVNPQKMIVYSRNKNLELTQLSYLSESHSLMWESLHSGLWSEMDEDEHSNLALEFSEADISEIMALSA